MFKFLGNIFANIGKFFSKVEKSKEVQDFESFCEELYSEEKVLIWSQLKDLAITAVTGLLASQISGSEKFSQAVKQVVTAATAQGIAYATSDVNKIVQDSYIYVKSKNLNAGILINGQPAPVNTGS